MEYRKYLPFDIETVENERAKLYFDLYWQPPKNIKKPELIEARRKEARKKGALKWWTGKVIMISFESHLDNIDVIYGDDEKMLLSSFAKLLIKSGSLPSGKNAENFDIPYLIGRYMANDMGIPACIMPYGDIKDIDKMFSSSKTCGQRSDLDQLAWGLGMDLKTADGSMVHDWYFHPDGPRWDLISDYCKNDTKIVAEAHRRFRPFLPPKESYR